MIEGTPGKPYGGLLAHFNVVEANMQYRRQEAAKLLLPGEVLMKITNFPRFDFLYYSLYSLVILISSLHNLPISLLFEFHYFINYYFIEIKFLNYTIRLGSPGFTDPPAQPTPNSGASRSLFFPDEAIFGGHPRFKTLTRNIRHRRGEKVAINIPSNYNFYKR